MSAEITHYASSITQNLHNLSQKLIAHNHATYFPHLPTLDLIATYISLLAESRPNPLLSANINALQLNELKENSKQVTMNIQSHIFALLQQEREENKLLRERIYEWIEQEGLAPPVGFTFRFEVSDKLRRSVKQIETFCLKKTRERILQAFQMKANGSTEEAQKLDLSGKEFTEMLESLDNFKEEIVHLVDYAQRYTDTSKEKFRSQAAELIAFNEILKAKSIYFASENMRLKQEMNILKEQNVKMQNRVDGMVNENSLFRQQIDELHDRLNVVTRRTRTPPTGMTMGVPSGRNIHSATPDHTPHRTRSPAASRPSSSTPIANHFMKRPHSSTGARRSAKRALQPGVSPTVFKVRASSSQSRREHDRKGSNLRRDTSHTQLLFEPPQLNTRPHSSMVMSSPRLFSKDERLENWTKPSREREEGGGVLGSGELQFNPPMLAKKRRASSALM